MPTEKPNILLIMTDQLRHPTVYENDDLRRFRREVLTAEKSLRDTGVSLDRHYAMAVACAPSRASLFTGQHPSLHGVTQTDGLAKSADGPEMFWLAPDTVPMIGDWFRAGVVEEVEADAAALLESYGFFGALGDTSLRLVDSVSTQV